MRYERVSVVITTCQRLHLFRRTMNSFMAACKDMDLIADWRVYDNGSTDRDLERMESAYKCLKGRIVDVREEPFARFRELIFGTMIPSKLVLFLEDDWLFFRAGHFIREAQEIMAHDRSIKEVTYRYFPDPVVKSGDLSYRLHEYRGEHGPDPDLYDCHWPGYSWNPSLQHVQAVRECMEGAWPARDIEHSVAKAFHAAGHRVAHTYRGYVWHIGNGQSVFESLGRPR